ncbi:MAG: hypothetical protein ABSC54_00850 [Smithellaceae bacterium]|jgi:hypothetical protein
MSQLTDIREQIKVILSGVPDIGMVHDYTRLAVDYTTVLNFFKTPDGQFKGVMFAREKMAKERGSSWARAHVFVFRAIMALNDGKQSGIQFDGMLDAIEREFEKYDDLNGTCSTCMPDFGPMAGHAGMQITIIEERMFGNVLCHYAEMRLCAEEYQS